MPVTSFLKKWLWISLLAAGVATSVDALLLQRSRSIFTGGFLSLDHLQGAGEIGLFLVLSLFVDFCVAGMLAALCLFIVGRWRVSVPAAAAAAWLSATGPLMLGDVASYQLTRYLGTDFDLGLMFDLTGRSVSEIFAVSSAYLLVPTVAIGLVAGMAVAFVWVLGRMPGERLAAPPARTLILPLALVAGGTLTLAVTVRANDAVSAGLLRKPSGVALAFLGEQVTDVDRDGFGLVDRLSDPDPFDRGVFPYARDLPGDGVDQDGIAGDLPRDAEKYDEPIVTGDPWQRRPDVLLIVLESFRADIVGARLDDRPITPVMDRLAAQGLSLQHAYSPNGYTIQSRFHMLAGTLIARRNTPTLVDDFKNNGYSVGYFSGQDESFGGAEYRVGFNRADVSYDARADVARRYSTFSTPGSLAVPFEAVQEKVATFVRERAGQTPPLFLYVNFEDTHFPYSHDGIAPLVSEVRLPRNQITPENREALWATYANTAANLDRAIGEIVEQVRAARGKDPAVVITADHGESLFESGFLGHGYGLNDVQTRVPFIVVNLPMRVSEPFSHLDMRAAINDALRVPADAPEGPVLRQTDRPLFQYLGDLKRPRQIAFLKNGNRLIYDFRTARVATAENIWTPVPSLQGPDRDVFLRLVRQWEWMNLSARRAGRNDRD